MNKNSICSFREKIISLHSNNNATIALPKNYENIALVLSPSSTGEYICNQIVKKGRPICNCTITFDSQQRKGVVFKNTAGAQSNMPLTHSTAPGQLQLATPITWRPAAAVVNHSHDSAIITNLQIVGWLIFLLAVEAPCSYFSPTWDFPHCKEVIHTLVKTKAKMNQVQLAEIHPCGKLGPVHPA